MASVVIRSPAIDAAFWRRPHNLGRVDDALGDEIDVLAVLGVEAIRVLVLLQDLADDDRPVFARIDDDLARRPTGALDDVDAGFLVVVRRTIFFSTSLARRSATPPAWQNTHLDRGFQLLRTCSEHIQARQRR